ncbi:MAG: hypothetical protein VXY07_02735 [Planctomycetota bacterium]|nr:hypothetical protein [Planctomycetota bacterium]
MKAKLGSPIVLIAIFTGGSLWGGMAILNAGLGMVQAQTERVATESRPGAEIVSECRKTLENVESLEVELSQQATIYGQQLNGKGQYLQQGQGTKMTRLVLNFSAGEQTASFRQINDGRFVYTKYETPWSSRFSQIDLLKAEEALGTRPRIAQPSEREGMTVGGGLLAVIRMLERDFEFTAAGLSKWGGQQVWHVEGRWKAESLVKYFGLPKQSWTQPESLELLPEYVPSHVPLTVGIDPPLPYFPYQISFLRSSTADRGRVLTPLSRMEVSGIRQGGLIDDAEFEFVPGDEVVDDDTDWFVKKQQNAKKQQKSTR